MYTVLYTITTQNKLFDGDNDLMQLNRDELTLAMNEDVMFWTDYQIDDPEMKLMHSIFKNRSL